MAPITSTFSADFSNFLAAVQKADVKLHDFEDNAVRVGSTLTRIGDRFTGVKVIQEALAMEKAIEEIGGASKLTETELKRVGATAQEAVAKMQALGKDVPAGLQKLADSTKTVTKELTLMEKASGLAKSTFGQMFSAFSAANLVDRAVSSLVSFGAAAIESAGHLADLEERTGLGVETLQKMDYAAQQTGTSLDAMTAGAAKLGVNISKGTKEARESVEALGLSYDTLRQQKPEEQFDAVVQALGRVESVQDRNRLGVQLLGKQYIQIAPALDEYINKAGDINKLSEEQVQALDKLGDTWTEFKRSLGVGLGQMIGSVGGFFDSVIQKADEFAVKIGRLSEEDFKKLHPPPTDDKPKKDIVDVSQALEDQAAASKKAEEADRKREAAAAKAAAALQQQKSVYESLVGLDVVGRTEEQARALLKFGSAADVSGKQLQDLRANVATSVETLTRLGDSTRAAKLEDFQRSLSMGVKQADFFDLALKALAPSVENAATEFATLRLQMAEFDKNVDISTLSLADLERMLGKTASAASDFNLKAPKGPSLLSGLKGGIADLTKGLTGGAGVGGFLSGLGKGITQGLGNMISGGITSAISAGLGLAVKGVGALFGKLTGAEAKETNRTRDAWIKQNYESADALRKLAFEAGATDKEVRALFDSRKVADFQLAAEKVQGIISGFADEQAADAERLEAAIQKYGFAIDDLGPALRKQKLDEQAKELIEDWRVLVGAGIDVAKVNDKMADAINDYLKTARRTGTEVPAAMRPVLQSLIDAGELTDDAGNAITNLEGLGITFAETMTQGFDRIVKKLDEVIKQLGGVGDAVDAIPDHKTITIETRWDNPDAQGFVDPIPGGAQEQFSAQKGTGGKYLDFGQGTNAVLHGRERVVTAAEGAAEATAFADMVTAVYGLQTTLVRAVRENALLVRDAALLARA